MTAQQKLDEMVRALCKIQSTIHSVDDLGDDAPFYKNHKSRLKNISHQLSTILDETSTLFGRTTKDDFAEAVKIIDAAALEIKYVEDESI